MLTASAKTSALDTFDPTTLPTLTAKQMAFVEGIAAGLDQTAAYRKAYDTTNWKTANVSTEASRLRNSPKVIPWMDALMRVGYLAALCTKEGHLRELQALKEMALNENKLGVAIRAIEMQGKVCGLYAEKKQTRDEDDSSRAFLAILERMNAKEDDPKVIEGEAKEVNDDE